MADTGADDRVVPDYKKQHYSAYPKYSQNLVLDLLIIRVLHYKKRKLKQIEISLVVWNLDIILGGSNIVSPITTE